MKQEKALKAKSSDGTTLYTVEFIWDGEELSVLCDCRAGLMKQHCRHKDSFIRGDKSLLADSSFEADLKDVVIWVNQSPVGKAMQELVGAEEGLKIAQAKAKTAKRLLEKVLYR